MYRAPGCCKETVPMCHTYKGGVIATLIAKYMGPSWGPHGADRTQVGPMLAPWTLLSRHFTSNIRIGAGRLFPLKGLSKRCKASSSQLIVNAQMAAKFMEILITTTYTVFCAYTTKFKKWWLLSVFNAWCHIRDRYLSYSSCMWQQ